MWRVPRARPSGVDARAERATPRRMSRALARAVIAPGRSARATRRRDVRAVVARAPAIDAGADADDEGGWSRARRSARVRARGGRRRCVARAVFAEDAHETQYETVEVGRGVGGAKDARATREGGGGGRKERGGKRRRGKRGSSSSSSSSSSSDSSDDERMGKKTRAGTLRDALAGVGGGAKKGKEGKKGEGKKMKKVKKSALEAKLGKIVSQKRVEDEARANAVGLGVGPVVDVAVSSTPSSAPKPTALITLGACPLLEPVVLGDATHEVPIARIEICAGKDCLKRGSEAIVDDLQALLPRGWKCEASGKCLGGCKRGINARLTTAIGREKFSYLDEASARALFVPMALATNELNASFDELDINTVRGGRRRVPVVAAAEAIRDRSDDGHRESYCPPGFMPKIQ